MPQQDDKNLGSQQGQQSQDQRPSRQMGEGQQDREDGSDRRSDPVDRNRMQDDQRSQP